MFQTPVHYNFSSEQLQLLQIFLGIRSKNRQLHDFFLSFTRAELERKYRGIVNVITLLNNQEMQHTFNIKIGGFYYL